jgi:hypothetical protein
MDLATGGFELVWMDVDKNAAREGEIGGAIRQVDFGGHPVAYICGRHQVVLDHYLPRLFVGFDCEKFGIGEMA